MKPLLLRRTGAIGFVVSVVVIACGASFDSPTTPLTPPARLASLTSGTGVSNPITNGLPSAPCAFVLNESNAAGTSVVIWNCFGSPAQTFSWMADGSIRAFASTTPMCLTSIGSGKDGDPIQIQACNGSTKQKWTASASGEIRGLKGKCLDVFNANPANGTKLVLWNCYGSAGQRWDNSPVITPPDTTPPPPPAIQIQPGQSIQAAVDANPAGSAFLIKAGTHTGQSVVPKAGDSFTCEAGAVLNGGASTVSAFGPGSTKPANVTVKKCEITSYGPTSGDYAGTGAITAGGHTTGEGTRGWLVDSNYIHDNRGMAIRLGHTMIVRGNRIIHNAGPLGIGGIGDSTQILNNEIATSNYAGTFAPGFEAGGLKFVLSYALVVRGNWSHHNVGFGLWGDIANRNATFDANTVEDNTHAGIFYEIGYGCTVTGNTVRRNGLGDPGNWLYPSNILIGHSPDCEVANNIVEGGVHGIMGIQQNRTDDTLYGPHLLTNLWVHDNTVSEGSGIAAGVGADYGTPFTQNNRFDRNTYTTNATWPFAWANSTRTAAEWRGYGQDVNGIFNP